MELLDNVIDYLYELTENQIFPNELSREERDLLPVFITQNYSVKRVNIFDREYVLLIHQKGERPTPAQAENYLVLVGDKLQAQVAFVFPRLDVFVRNRLISKKVPFIIPFQHLYLPQGLVDIREQPSKVSIMDRNKISISDPAQIMLLYFLLHRNHIDEWPLNEWSEQLNYSRMSISRAWKELAAIDLCEGQKKGRNIFLQFIGSSKALWERALPYLHNPVRHRKMAIIQDNKNIRLQIAGITALANKTRISGGSREEFAIKLSDWNTAINNEFAYEVSAANDQGKVIETWSYDPKILAPNSESVDELSLYLSLQNKPDERVQGALIDLLEGFPW